MERIRDYVMPTVRRSHDRCAYLVLIYWRKLTLAPNLSSLFYKENMGI
jgi:hypothetical protein